MTLHISRFNNRQDNQPKPVEIEWDDLARSLTKIREREKQDGELWSPARFLPGGTRSRSNALDLWLVVLDFDDGLKPDEARQKWDELGLEYVVHSTWHHQQKKHTGKAVKPAVDRWRAVFPLESPLPAAEWKNKYTDFAEYLAPGRWDPACKDPSRIFWLPSAKTGAPSFSEHVPGRLLRPDEPPITIRRAKKAPSTQHLPDWLGGALEHIPAGEYDVWTAVGMAIKHEAGDDGFETWDTWSQGASNYPTDGETTTRAKWDSFAEQGEVSADGKAVTLGTVHRLAVEAGWEPPARAYTGTPAVPETDESEAEWRKGLTYRQSGQDLVVEKTAGNLALYLANDEKWRGCIAYDELAHCVTWIKPPFSIPGMEAPSGRLIDEHYTWVQQAARWSWSMQWSRTAVIEAGALAARVKSVHPVKAYLDGLSWDGVPRLDNWLATYLGSSERAAAVGRWWLVSAVARAYRPGCQADHVLVLEGRQGLGKSSAIRALGGDWYSGNLGKLSTVDGPQSLLGKWIIEIGELDALKGMAATRVKDFISLTCDDYRPSYGRNTVHRLRQCVFCGSTNEGAYLHDPTGSRRFWPVKVSKVDLDALVRDRDQLWAQARDAYMDGARWWPRGQEENEALARAAEERFAVDPWEDEIKEWVMAQSGGFSVNEALSQLGVDVDRRTTRDSMRVGAILRRLGFKSCHTRSGNLWRRA